MTLPNKTGGVVHSERTQKSKYNNDGTSRALFANQPNEEGWEPDPEEVYDEEPRQCAASQTHYVKCVDCGQIYSKATNRNECPECKSILQEKLRCQGVAVPEYMTCYRHGGGFKQKPEVLRKAKMASMTDGMSVTEVMHCPCKMHKDICPYKEQYHDNNGWARCLPEKKLYESIISFFQQHYEVDEAADMLMLNRLAMTLVRIERGEKIIARYGEITERERFTEGGKETWYEESAASKIVDKLDRRLQSWLKELAVTKAAREGRKVEVSGSIDIANILTNIPKETDEVIDL